jgi:hypothetical protein
VPDAPILALANNAGTQAGRRGGARSGGAKAKQVEAQAALRAVNAALAEDDASSVLARLEETRKSGVELVVLDERRRRLRDRVETLAIAAASEVKLALQKNDAAAARAAIKRARDLKAQAETLDAAQA